MWQCPPANVLVPVDFGEASGRAIEVAAGLAAKHGAVLHLLHAESVETPPYFTPDQMATIERERRAARGRAGAALGEFARRHGAGELKVVVREGSPPALILDATRGTDLVVMGTHGRHGPSRWWMGSVAERVVRESQVPVLVVRGESAVDPALLFGRSVVLSRGAGESEVSRAAAYVAALGGQTVGEPIACRPGAASERDATLVVVPQGEEGGRGWDAPVERWLRACRLPMLFVPGRCARKEEGE